MVFHSGVTQCLREPGNGAVDVAGPAQRRGERPARRAVAHRAEDLDRGLVGLPLLLAYQEKKGKTISAKVRENIAPLKSVILAAAQDGNLFRLHGFVGIK